MKKFFSEFKEFINRGNVMDLAVAVVIGAAFTAIVNSVVSDLIMPLISLVTGGVNFSDMKISLGSGPDAAAFTYGNFINAVIQFVIIAFVVFREGDEPGAHVRTARQACRGNGCAPLPVLSRRGCRRCHPMPPLHVRAARSRRAHAESVGLTNRLVVEG